MRIRPRNRLHSERIGVVDGTRFGTGWCRRRRKMVTNGPIPWRPLSKINEFRRTDVYPFDFAVLLSRLGLCPRGAFPGNQRSVPPGGIRAA